jgi:signal transduction histidine kinase
MLLFATGLVEICSLRSNGARIASGVAALSPLLNSRIEYKAATPMPNFRPTKVRTAFGIALLVLIAAALLSFWDISRVMETARQIADTNAVLDRLDDLLEAFRDSVSASRGTAPDAVQLHNRAVESMHSALSDVRQHTINKPDQQQRIASLESDSAQIIALERRRIEVVARDGMDAGDVVFRDGGGRDLDVQIRRFIAEIKNSEASVLALRKAQQERRVHTSHIVITASLFLAFAILLEVYYHLEREIGRRQLSENEIRRLNEELEKRVLERTSQLCEANKLLASQNEELARASRMKSEFLARMSHEFRTPLNSIIGFSDLLAEEGEGPLGEVYPDYVRHVSDGAHHLLALVNDILDLSRIEAGRIDLHHEKFAAAEAISEVLSVTGPLAEVKKIELRSEVSPTVVAYGDRTRFKQILYNLLSNAIKFTPAVGRVEVNAEPDYGEIRFRVSDTGIGIPPDQQNSIFEEFTQVAPATSGVKEGAGLGLTITRRIVELHGGRIWVESTPGQGSRFFFTIPAASTGNGVQFRTEI